MKRREFIAGLAGAAAWPVAASVENERTSEVILGSLSGGRQ